MKIVNVEEKQGKEKPYWNITIENGPSKYANWFTGPAPVVGMTEFSMTQGKAYVDKQGKERHYWNAGPDRLASLEKRVEAIEKYLNGNNGQSLGNNAPNNSSIPDDGNPF